MTTPSSTGELLAGIPNVEQGNLGIIPISALMMPHILPLDTYHVINGQLIFNIAFEDIHERLLLPDTYRIEGVFFDVERALWHIMVRSEQLSVTPEGAMLPKVIPIYTKDTETGVVTLTKLEIQEVRPPQSVTRCCYLCGGPDEQICIVCGRNVCQNDIAPDIRPGDKVICRECDPITPDRVQARKHFILRETVNKK